MNTLIIGATGGIGSALARGWPRGAADGLWLAGRDESKLAPLAGELGAAPLIADLGFESRVRAMFEGIASPLDTLIYAAGAVQPEPLSGAGGEATRRVWNANYFGALWTLKYGLGKLAPGGRAYFFGARPALVTARGFAQYAASKAALARALEIARLEHRTLSLTLVLPPAVDTPLWQALGKPPRGAMRPQDVAAALLRNRFGEEAEHELLIGAPGA